MSHFIKCYDCGKEISSEAKICPICGSRHPGGKCCYICGNVSRLADLVPYELSRPSDRSEEWVHSSCIKDIIKDLKRIGRDTSWICPLCETVNDGAVELSHPARGHSSWEFRFSLSPCSQCGQPPEEKLAEPCHHCHLPVFYSFAETASKGNACDRGPRYFTIFFHKQCFHFSTYGKRSSGCLGVFLAVLISVASWMFYRGT